MRTVTITFISLAATILSFIYAVSKNYQYCLLLIVVIIGYDFKETTLSNFDSTDSQ